ncbi:diguanylate cyclase [Synechococcus sp. CBW1006]|nr:diguanylate cyclase [Synechococcus sp. CBW1006]
MLILHLAMVGLFLLDLALPRNVPLLPYYFLVVVLSASVVTPRRMIPLIVQAYALAIASGLYWGFFPSTDYLTRLLALSGVVAVAVHLAAQRSRESAQRRRSEELFRTTIDNSAAGVGLTDASGRFFLTNPAFCEILGCDPQSTHSLHWQDITHPDDVKREQVLVEEILANRRSSYRIKVRTGSDRERPVWIDLCVSCSRNPSGDVEFLIGQFIDITLQVEAEGALNRTEQLLHRTLEQCSVGLALCAPDTGTILQANGQLSSLLGLGPAVLARGSLKQVFAALELVSVEDPQAGTPMDPAALASVLRGEIDGYGVRVRFRRADGLRGWGNLQLSNLRDAHGAVEHVLLELDEITEIVAQAEYLLTAAAAGVVGIWDWDPVNDVLTWDSVMYQIYGVDPEKFSGAVEAWSQTVHPEDRQFALSELAAAVRGEREYALRFRVVWPDGGVRYIQAASRRFFDDAGKVVRIMGVNYDVTELVQAQQQLKAEQQRLSITLDSLLDPHLLLGPVRDEEGRITDLRILRANPAAAAYNHMPLDEFVGSTLRQFWPGHVENGLFDRYLQVLATGEPLVLDEFEYHQHEVHGGIRQFDIRVVKVGDELSVIWRDVTERIAIKKALELRAATDSLTTLLNREEVFTQIERLMGRDQRRGGELAVLFCDLDRFKEVNDTYGHQAGDAVLQAMAERLRSCLRASDLAARIGGDELMVVLPGVQGLEDAIAIGEKLRRLASEPVPIPEGEAQITVSVGVALARPGESMDDLIAWADGAMYAAKERGRNQVVAIPA